MNMTFISPREVKYIYKYIYFICGFATHEIIFFHFTRWNKCHIHDKNLNILFTLNEWRCILLVLRVLSRIHLHTKLSLCTTKTTKWSVHPAKTQISLGIRPVWSESSQSAWRRIGTLATHWAYSEVSDLSRLMPRLNWDFAGRTCHFFWFCRAAAQIKYCKYLVLSVS